MKNITSCKSYNVIVVCLYCEKLAEPLNRIVNTIKSKPQNEANDLKEALKNVEKAGEELNKLKHHLKACFWKILYFFK